MTKAEMIKELKAICCCEQDVNDTQWAVNYWESLSEQDLEEELVDARANKQMADAEGSWEDGGCV